jgi:hypothetical protein
MLQEPEHGDGHDANYDHWYGHNIHTDDYYPYYEQYQSDINICFVTSAICPSPVVFCLSLKNTDYSLKSNILVDLIWWS